MDDEQRPSPITSFRSFFPVLGLLSPSMMMLCAPSGVPVWFEPVSVAKSKRAAAVFSGITVVSPNQNELKAMAEATGAD